MNIPTAEVLRAAVIAVITSFFPVLQVLNIVDWTSDQLAVVMLFVMNVVTMAFLFYRGPVAPTT